MITDRVKMVEVSPRDGLQNEQQILTVDQKLRFIELLRDAGLQTIEITSCVPSKWVPQLADHLDIIHGVEKSPSVDYPVLVPNMRGLRDGLDAGAESLSIIASASETFSRKNSNCSIDEGLTRCGEILQVAVDRGLRTRGYVSCTLGCPFEGKIGLGEVVRVATRLHELGCREIALSDTNGVGTPAKVGELIKAAASNVPLTYLAVHFHDTYGQALANIYAALELGVRTVDSSVAGLGGCPYAKGATGNVASEDLLYMLDGLGMETGVDLTRLRHAGDYICKLLGRETNSKVAIALSGS